MDYVRIWDGVNELGERVELLHCVQLNRYAIRMNERTNELVTFDEKHMGQLMSALGSYLIHVHMPERE